MYQGGVWLLESTVSVSRRRLVTGEYGSVSRLRLVTGEYGKCIKAASGYWRVR